jgi:hypothetical protein
VNGHIVGGNVAKQWIDISPQVVVASYSKKIESASKQIKKG